MLHWLFIGSFLAKTRFRYRVSVFLLSLHYYVSVNDNCNCTCKRCRGSLPYSLLSDLSNMLVGEYLPRIGAVLSKWRMIFLETCLFQPQGGIIEHDSEPTVGSGLARYVSNASIAPHSRVTIVIPTYPFTDFSHARLHGRNGGIGQLRCNPISINGNPEDALLISVDFCPQGYIAVAESSSLEDQSNDA